MTETTILDDRAVSEIEARKPFYFCNKCGYFGETGPIHLKPGYEVDCSYNAVRPTSELTIDALCATVKHLRAVLKETNATLDAVRRRADTNYQCTRDLQSQLEQWERAAGHWKAQHEVVESRFAQVEQERNELRQEVEGLRYQRMFTDSHVGDD